MNPNSRLQKRASAQRSKKTLWLLIAACLLLFLLVHALQGTSPLTPSNYNSYTLQAMQWRRGKIALDEDIPYLELAVYQGRYYVSFPPVPAVPLFLLTFLFGARVPDALLLQLYALIACLLIYRMLLHAGLSCTRAAIWAFLICFASSLLALLQNGGVWYQAQVLAFLLIIAAMERMQHGKPTASLLLFALSVGCRPFHVLYGLLLILWGVWLSHQENWQQRLRRLIPGICLGICVALGYGVYNWLRFHNPLEFGHSYLPEFSTQGGSQFSVGHIATNAPVFVWGWPFAPTPQGLGLSSFGFSLFIANPILLCLVIWLLSDLFSQRKSIFSGVLAISFAGHILLLLSHRTVGGYQYGARYFVDCIPYAVFYLASKSKNQNTQLSVKTPAGAWQYILLLAGLGLAIIGAAQIRI